MKLDEDLVALARSYGIATEYWDQVRRHREISATTIRAALAAFGVDASTPRACRAAREAYLRRHWLAVVPPVAVVRQPAAADKPWQSWVHVPQGASVRIWVELETGGIRHDLGKPSRRGESFEVDGQRIDEYVSRLPPDLPLGWHRLVAELGGERHSCVLVVCPARLESSRPSPQGRQWGISTQLYSMRSIRSWGIGDLADLADLAAWSGRELGADFVLVNPLHAAAPVPEQEPSPYLPATRLYANPLYIRIESIAEFAYLPLPQREAIEALSAPLRRANSSADLLDRQRTWKAKREALALVSQVPRSIGRQAEYRRYTQARGKQLRRFAIWCALAEKFGPYWHQWPSPLRDPDSKEVAEQEQLLADRVEFYRWAQWIVDQQLAAAQQSSREAGMELGVIHDLAVGVHRFGFETWSDPGLFATAVTVGAPPDEFNQIGQDWSQPPMRPDRLAEAGYLPFRDLIRALFDHGGGLRIDHILGFFRLWWIPAGMTPADGTYVKYDHEALASILVLEAQRAGALVVGEDLGTVEPWVADFLADRGILGTSVLWFERDDRGPRPPQLWRADTMAAVSIHDLPPAGAYLSGSQVRLRAELGLLNRSSDADAQAQAHQREIAEWRELLVQLGFVRPEMTDAQMVVALYRLAAWSPARLLAVALPDLVADRRTQNQPGTDKQYPNWRIPLCGADGKAVLLNDLPDRPELAQIVAAIGGRRSTQ